RRRGDAEQRELDAEEAHQLALRRAEAAHHRATVQVALDETPRRERDRYPGEHRGEQRRQPEVALGAIDRRAHLRPAALQVVDALAALEARLGPAFEAREPL